jgi:hypothetical protein
MSRSNQQDVDFLTRGVSVEEDETPTYEALRQLADLIDEARNRNTVAVLIEPDFLRSVADELEEALSDRIDVLSSDGSEVIATIEGELASHVISCGVKNYIEEALLRELQKPEVDVL